MSDSSVAIEGCPGPTLLTYSPLLEPDPFCVKSNGSLTLVVSKSTPGAVTCSEIKVTFLVGKAARDLTASPSSIGVTPPSPSWRVDNPGSGVITLTPSGDAGEFGPQGIAFVFGSILVNGEAGATVIRIDETAFSASDPTPATRSLLLPLSKFPEKFSVSDLVITPAEVAFGGSTSVMWTGTGTPATYRLEYPGCPTGGKSVSNVGPFETPNLTTFPAAFTLTVSVAVPGQDEPLVVQRQKVAELLPELRIVDFRASTTLVAAGDVLVLSWEVELETSLSLQLSNTAGQIDVTGLSGCSISSDGSPVLLVADPTGKQLGTLSPGTPFPEFLNFVLTASNNSLGSSGSIQQPLQIEVAAPVIDFSWSGGYGNYDGYTPLMVSWKIEHASRVTIEPDIGSVPAAGYQQVDPFVTLTLTATGFGGFTVIRQLTPGQ